MFEKYLSDHLAINNLLQSAVLFCIFAVLRFLTLRLLRSSKDMGRKAKRKLSLNINSLLTILFIIGLFAIWANELKTMALSFVAVAAAIVIATKELILCLCGTFYKTVSHPFSIGDRIELGGVRGDVIDSGFFSTKVLEIGPGDLSHQYTGRSVSIPNSLYLTEKLINESFLQDYLLHIFTVNIPRDSNWVQAESILLKVSNEICHQYIEKAQAFIDKLQKKQNLETPSVAPRVHIKLNDVEEVLLIARVTVPARDKGRIEQLIIRRFLEEFYTQKG